MISGRNWEIHGPRPAELDSSKPSTPTQDNKTRKPRESSAVLKLYADGSADPKRKGFVTRVDKRFLPSPIETEEIGDPQTKVEPVKAITFPRRPQDIERVYPKGNPDSNFHTFLVVQHLAIKQTDEDTNYLQPEAIDVQEEVGDDVEALSDHSAEEVHDQFAGKPNQEAKKDKVLVASMSTDGQYLALACPDHTVGLFKLLAPGKDGNERSRFLFDPHYRSLSRRSGNKKITHLTWATHPETVAALYLDIQAIKSPQLLLVVSADHLVTFWLVTPTLATIVNTIQAHDLVSCLQLKPGFPPALAVGTFDKNLRVYELSKRENVVKELINTSDTPMAILFSPHGQSLFVGMQHGTCRVYGFEGGSYKLVKDIKCSNSNILQLKGQPVIDIKPIDGDELLLTCKDSRVRRFSRQMEELSMKYKGHKCNKHPLKADYQQGLVSSPSENGYVFFWARTKPKTKNKCWVFGDKKLTNKTYEYCLPFPKKSRLEVKQTSVHRCYKLHPNVSSPTKRD